MQHLTGKTCNNFLVQDGKTFVSFDTLVEEAKYPIVFAPLNGTHIPVKVRRLTTIQIKTCGDFSLIETLNDKRKKHKEPQLKQVIAFKKTQHKACKLALESPTYEEIVKVLEADKLVIDAKEKIKELQQLVDKLPEGTKKKVFEDELNTWKLWADFVLPDDFLSFIFRLATSQDISDIKLVSEEMLLNAAILADKGHDNPHNHIEGKFTHFNKVDIDQRAWMVYHKFQERQSSGKRKR